MGGATDSVSNNLNLLTDYKVSRLLYLFKQPLMILHSAVIIGKGTLSVVTEDNEIEQIDNVYYCPKATTTIISPGALLAKGATMVLDKGNNYSIRVGLGKVIWAFHKHRWWFINARLKKNHTRSTFSTSVCAIKKIADLSKLWHNRFGHVYMKHIRKLFKSNNEYSLPSIMPSKDIVCEDCLKCKSTQNRTLGSTNRNHNC